MVKIPGLDNLKKVGSDLLDSAKTVNIGGYVDKIKSGVDSMRKGSDIPQGSEAIKTQFETLYATLKELNDLRDAESVVLKNLQGQISDLAKIITATQNPPSTTVTKEDTKIP